MTDILPVLIAGGGPVGLSLALDLGWRGVGAPWWSRATARSSMPRCS
jgi:hypothetical protein